MLTAEKKAKEQKQERINTMNEIEELRRKLAELEKERSDDPIGKKEDKTE